MAQIDTSELLTDPDFIDPVILVHRTPTVNTYGENTLAESQVSTVGSVQPTSGKTVLRLPDALRTENLFSFWVKLPIQVDGTSVYPDVLIFKDIRYQVKHVFDWTNWGQGWTEGVCVAEKPNP